MYNLNLTKVKFLLPAIAILLTVMTAGQLYFTSIDEEDLKSTSGTVSKVVRDKYKHYKYTDDRIRIWLHNHQSPYYLFDNRGDIFNIVLSNITEGDSITIWHRTSAQSTIGTGSEFKIMQVSKAGTKLYSFKQAKETFSSVGNFTIYVTIAMWLLYIYALRKLRKQPKDIVGSA